MRVNVELSRRALLAVCVVTPALVVPACSSTPTQTPVDEDGDVKRTVATSEQALIIQYRATLAAYPEMVPRLQSILTQHEEHFTAMGGDPLALSVPADTATPPNRSRAINALLKLERTAAKQRTVACGQAADVELAWTLALIGASEASHVEFLGKRVSP